MTELASLQIFNFLVKEFYPRKKIFARF